jgi:hypothetical protein
MSHSLLQTEGGSAANTLPLTNPAAVDPLPFELREHLQRLHLILPVISNAVAALRRQNADIDADIAYDLTEQACEPLDYEIQRIEYLLASHARRHRQREAQA